MPEHAAADPNIGELIKNGSIKSLIVDGLDGSGKGSCSEALAKKLITDGNNVLAIDFPVYELPWGKFLDHLLHVNRENLSMRDRMLVYALNRLEALSALESSIKALYKSSNRPLYILFDRFSTSNAITAAAYFLETEQEVTPGNINLAYAFMRNIDQIFEQRLGLENAKVYVPMLESADTIKSISNDATRANGVDDYERSEIQETAREVYLEIARIDPERFSIFSQYKEDGSRMTPEENAQYILNLDGYNKPRKIFRRGEITKFSARQEDVDTSLVNSLLSNYGTDSLKEFNPYN